MSARAKIPAWARKLLVILGWFIAALVALGVAALLFLQTPAGGRRLQALVLSAAHGAIEGPLDIASLRLRGTTLRLEGLELRTPEGELVARIASVELRPALLSLLRHRVRILTADVERPELFLRRDSEGLNLSRALAARQQATSSTPAAAPPASKPSTWSVALDQFTLRGGQVRYEEPAEDRRLRFEDLVAEARVAWSGATQGLTAELKLHGRSTEPVEGPVDLTVATRGDPSARVATLGANVAGARTQATLQTTGADQAVLTLEQLLVPPRVMRVLSPDYPLKAPVSLHGRLDRQGDKVALKLEGAAASARLAAEGSVDLTQKRTPGATLRLRRVDLAQLLEGGPASNLSGTVKVVGGGPDLAQLEAQLDIDVPASLVRGQPVGPVRAQVRAHHGQLDVSELLAVLPGLTLKGQGMASRRSVHFRGQLQASDLSRLGRAFAGIGNTQLPTLHGSGALAVTLDGPTADPALTAQGHFRALQYEDKSLQDFDLQLQMPHVRRFLETNALIQAQSLRFGSRVFTAVRIQLTTQGRQLDGYLQTRGLANARFHVGGELDPDGNGIQLAQLGLQYPDGTWTLDRPAHLRFPEGTFIAEPLIVSSGSQRVMVVVDKRPGHLSLEAVIEQLDLGHLPKAAGLEPYQLGGTVSARLRAEGDPHQPSLEGNLVVTRGKVASATDLGLTMDASYTHDRAQDHLRGHVDAQALGSRLMGSFDLPMRALFERRHVPLSAEVKVTDFDLGRTACALGSLPNADQLCDDDQPVVQGKATCSLHLSGTADLPRVTLSAQARGLQSSQLPATDADFEIRSTGPQLASSLDLRLLTGHAGATVKVPVTLAELLKRVQASQTRQLPIQLELAADHLDLGKSSLGVLGSVSARAKLAGTVAAPLGTASVTVAGLHTEGMLPADTRVDLLSGDRQVQAKVTAKNRSGSLADLTGHLDAPLERLWSRKALSAAPLILAGAVGPLQLEDFGLTAVGNTRTARKIRGTLNAAIAAQGTLADPQLTADVRLAKAGVGDTALGQVDAAYAYATGQHRLHAQLTSAAGGTLDVKGHLAYQVSLAAPPQPLREAPLTAQVSADQFHLDMLSGALPMVRRVAGELRTQATLSGTVGKPQLQGELDWTDGALSLEGYGEYDSITLLTSLTNDQLVLKELSAHAGAGRAQAYAEAVKEKDHYQLGGQLLLDKFPLVSDDQLLATASLHSSFIGTANDTLISLDEVKIPEAHFELPAVKRKDLQPLSRPDDIILTRNGVPVDRKARKAFEEERKKERGKSVAQVEEEEEERAEAEEPSPPRQVVAVLDAPRNLWVKGEDVNLEAGLSDGFRVEYQEEPQIFGSVRVLRGRVTVLGRQFDVQRNSRVDFTGPPADPALNATAIYTNPREGVKVKMVVSGQGKDIKLSPSSEPPLSETEIYTLLATGRTSLKRGTGASEPSAGGQAVSILGSLVADQLKHTLSDKLPLDVFSIEAGEESSTQGITGSVEAGRYFGDRFYLGYQGRIGADPSRYQNSNSVRLEYQLGPHLSADAEYGDAREGGLDLIWSRDF